MIWRTVRVLPAAKISVSKYIARYCASLKLHCIDAIRNVIDAVQYWIARNKAVDLNQLYRMLHALRCVQSNRKCMNRY